MITEIRIQNFKAIADLRLPLEQLTVFVGPNGVGKTSVLQAVAHVMGSPNVSARPLGQDLSKSAGYGDSGLERLRRRGASAPTTIELDVLGREFKHRSTLRLSSTGKARLNRARLRAVPQGSALMLQLSARRLAEPAYSDEDVPMVQPNGTGLAAVLADLATTKPDALTEITAHLRQIVPAVRRVRVEREKITQLVQQTHLIDGQRVQVQREEVHWGHRVLLDTVGGDGIPAEHISEGTILTLGLFTILYGRRPGVLLLDDLDRALHPKAQVELIAVLRETLDIDTDLQILATSHSPYLLDELRFEEVRLLTARPDGTVIGGSLTEHPDYELWKDSVRPGELWTSRLETWLAERPGPAA